MTQQIIDDDGDNYKSRKISINQVLDSWKRQSTINRDQLRPEVQRIMALHNLIKKQTILVCIAITGTITYFICTGIYFDFALESGWDVLVNSICVWMMLDTSKVYWNACRKYGICSCCYRKTNKLGL